MARVSVIDHGAVPNDETYDNGPAFAAAVGAAGRNGTVVLPAGVWHVLTYPEIRGAFPTVEADKDAFIEYHLDTDYNGTPTVEQMQKFVAYQDGFGVDYAWRMLGLGVTS